MLVLFVKGTFVSLRLWRVVTFLFLSAVFNFSYLLDNLLDATTLSPTCLCSRDLILTAKRRTDHLLLTTDFPTLRPIPS